MDAANDISCKPAADRRPTTSTREEVRPMAAITVPARRFNNGVEMPALGLGVFQSPPDETRDAVRAARPPHARTMLKGGRSAPRSS